LLSFIAKSKSGYLCQSLLLTSIIIIWCSIGSGNLYAPPTPLKESSHRILWSLQITITLIERTMLIFLQSGVKKLLAWAASGIESTTLDLSSQSGAYDLSAMATPSN